MLTVLGSLAEIERELIRSRTSEGRERAKVRGVVMGRKPKLTPHQRLAKSIGRICLTILVETWSHRVRQ
jgi:DNA invertase Pin-like site-specific DNA recombinase